MTAVFGISGLTPDTEVDERLGGAVDLRGGVYRRGSRLALHVGGVLNGAVGNSAIGKVGKVTRSGRVGPEIVGKHTRFFAVLYRNHLVTFLIDKGVLFPVVNGNKRTLSVVIVQYVDMSAVTAERSHYLSGVFS